MKQENHRPHDQVENRQHLFTQRPQHPRPAGDVSVAGRGSQRPCLGVGDAGTGYTWILCGYLYAHFTHVLILRGNVMKKDTHEQRATGR
jgi:hypothetical protein